MIYVYIIYPCMEYIQWSFHIFIFEPSPILHLVPSLIMCLACARLRQVKEEWLGIYASMKEQSEKYFALRTQWSNVLRFCINLQPCLASKARLNIEISWKPIPPSCFSDKVYSIFASEFSSLCFVVPTKIYQPLNWSPCIEYLEGETSSLCTLKLLGPLI